MSRSNDSSSNTSSGYCPPCHPLNLDGEVKRRPRSKTSGWNSKRVWPRDKGRGGRWSQFKDVCSGKGPDIFVTSQRSHGPHRAEWSNWSGQQLQRHGCYSGSMLDNLACPCWRYHQLDAPFWARRSPEQVYDFKSRRYCKPGYEDWQYGRRDRQKNRHPIYSFSHDGLSHVADEFDSDQDGPDLLRLYRRRDRGFSREEVNQCPACINELRLFRYFTQFLT